LTLFDEGLAADAFGTAAFDGAVPFMAGAVDVSEDFTRPSI
jgi:hypothetical protein